MSFKSIVVLLAATCVVGAGCSSSSKTASPSPTTAAPPATTTTVVGGPYTPPVCTENGSAPVTATRVTGSTSDYDVVSFDGTKIRAHWFPLTVAAGVTEPTVLKGENSMRVFQEEIFGPVLAVTTFRDEAEALEIANDTMYGLGAGVWTRDGSRAFRMGRAIKAGRVWTNCYHLYPAGAAFGGYKSSGVGRENHRMMLDHYTQTKCLLVSYDPEPLGFF